MGHFLSLSYHDTVNQIKAPIYQNFAFPNFLSTNHAHIPACVECGVRLFKITEILWFPNIVTNQNWTSPTFLPTNHGHVYDFLQSYIKPRVKLYDFQTLLLKKHPAGFCQPNVTIRIRSFHAVTFETPLLWYNFFLVWKLPTSAKC